LSLKKKIVVAKILFLKIMRFGTDSGET